MSRAAMSDPRLEAKDPGKLFLRREEVSAWMGLSRYQLAKLIGAGVIRGRRLHPKGKLYFPREHVREVIHRLQSQEE
jgi:hypothetical protein